MLNTLNIKKIVYGWFTVFVVLYFLSASLSPIDPAIVTRYQTSEFALRLATLAILVPVVGIWACAAYGFVHFKQYALSIKGSPYGKGTNTIANGLGIFALQLLTSGGLSVITSVPAIKEALGGDKGVTIITSCLGVMFSIAAMLVIYLGASQLVASLSKRTKLKVFTKSFYLLAIISSAYLISIALKYPVHSSTNNIYSYVPLITAILVVGIPYIVVWNVALLAVKRLYYYRRHVKGTVYKQALGLLTTGLYLIMGSSVLMQLLSTLGGALADLKLLPLLVIVYILILIIGIGYLYIAKSAKRLRRVES